jgi:hypothetical protein
MGSLEVEKVFENLIDPTDPLHPRSDCVKHPTVHSGLNRKKHAWDSGTRDTLGRQFL